jgi:outer membrane protein OmpA-like peptidoglycan-associated protein
MINRIALFLLFLSGFSYAQNQEKIVTLFFASNDYSINLDSEKTLDTFFSDEKISVSTIEIDGYCDDIGSLESNKILSVKRANSVAEYLQDNYNLEVDSSEGKGEIEVNLSSENLDELRKANRKAVLKIRFSKTSDKVSTSLLKTYSGYKKFQDNLKVGDKILIENIVFKGSLTHFVDDEIAERELNKIVKYLNENPSVTIEINGHVCCISKSFEDARDLESGTNNLSETRAKKIYDYLISKAIAKNRMTYAGYGRQFPIPNTEELLNKRVEVVIVKL